jgi:hypothetical protein
MYLGGWATIPVGASAGRHECPGRQGLGGGRRPWDAALATLGGTMATAGLQRVGFRAVGRVWHLVDRIDR